MWTEGAVEALQDCFKNQMWGVAISYQWGSDAAVVVVEENVKIMKPKEPVHVLPILGGCDEENLTIRGNPKPWVTGGVRNTLKAGKPAFESGDERQRERAIRLAKRAHGGGMQPM